MEVMLAIAIFGLALVAIGELVRIGNVNAAAARDLTEAQRVCNNVMAEVGAGIIPPDSSAESPVEGSEDWLYTIESEPLEEQTGMLRVSVKVQQDPSQYIKPVDFTLVRWMTDPAAVEAAKAEAEAAAASATSGSSTSGASGTPSSGSPSSSGSAPSSSSPSGSSTKAGGASGS